MFVFLKPKHTSEPIFLQTTNEQFKRHDNFKLPQSCRTTILNIENNCNNLSVNCCKDLFVFSDNKQINVDPKLTEQGGNIEQNKTDSNGSDDFNVMEVPNAEKTVESTYVKRIECKSTVNHYDTTKKENVTITSFYECKISVKGFKDQLIKGKSIWIH